MREEKTKYETAILAKEKGFKQWCQMRYNNKKELENSPSLKYSLSQKKLLNFNPEQVFAPTQTMLSRWLREKHKIDVIPTFSEFGRTYGYKIYFIQNGETDFINHRYSKHETFEEAMEIALQEALKLIKYDKN
jgi:uncharacterized membrane-anchored protein